MAGMMDNGGLMALLGVGILAAVGVATEGRGGFNSYGQDDGGDSDLDSDFEDAYDSQPMQQSQGSAASSYNAFMSQRMAALRRSGVSPTQAMSRAAAEWRTMRGRG